MQAKRTKVFVAGAVLVLIVLTACGARTFATATPPVGVAAAATPVAACTPTPAVRHPTFTIGPDQRATPGAVSTEIVRYQATYPGDVFLPARTTDLDPQVPANEKQTVIVRHVDCTYEGYLMAGGRVPSFQSNVPAGDTVVSISPLPSSAYIHGYPPSPPVGLTPGVGYGADGKPVTVTVLPPGGIPSPPPPALQTAAVRQLETRIADGTRAANTSSPGIATPTR